MADTFALGTFGDFPGLVVADRVLDLSRPGLLPGAVSTTLDLLRAWDVMLPRLAELARDETLPWQGLAGLDVRAPVAPGQIFQCGANYRTHVIDLAVAHRRPDDTRSVEEIRAEAAATMDARAAGTPYVFLGLPSAVAGPYDDLVLPSYSEQHDWELELAAVIGRRAFRVAPADALGHVAGYTVVNDITTRDLVFRPDVGALGADWFRAKNAPGFLPTGPWIVPARFVGDPLDLRVTLKLNGETMQDESTKDMIFGVPALIASISQITPLHPGDLVLTGSPAGNGAHWGRLLRDGDVMEATISRLGTQRVRAVAPPT
ncbi:fumarylacetoacetate hydrolase family protein [Actinoplanes sp. KI2]|uniref:fumarylacetoacetate hydrolase family protein n=1 Tax=Actinoplanes sp. KI2 TaxID=2983315 RepID=UPI0021D58761|nr:fumarylacetoacetate hydrolase family protein [Actinoplanes sp. KI2]MCU7729585.1 fumarylacetoacetate hydrolase family protein [Actinoplanes sp. KI2]